MKNRCYDYQSSKKMELCEAFLLRIAVLLINYCTIKPWMSKRNHRIIYIEKWNPGLYLCSSPSKKREETPSKQKLIINKNRSVNRPLVKELQTISAMNMTLFILLTLVWNITATIYEQILNWQRVKELLEVSDMYIMNQFLPIR